MTPSAPDAIEIDAAADLLWQAAGRRDPVLQTLRGRLNRPGF